MLRMITLIIPKARIELNSSGIGNNEKNSSRENPKPSNIAIIYNLLNCRKYAIKHRGSEKNRNPIIRSNRNLGNCSLNWGFKAPIKNIINRARKLTVNTAIVLTFLTVRVRPNLTFPNRGSLINFLPIRKNVKPKPIIENIIIKL